jgi:hypothetical protein
MLHTFKKIMVMSNKSWFNIPQVKSEGQRELALRLYRRHSKIIFYRNLKPQ